MIYNRDEKYTLACFISHNLSNRSVRNETDFNIASYHMPLKILSSQLYIIFTIITYLYNFAYCSVSVMYREY